VTIRRVIYLALPIGSNFGWGVCGKYIAREMARRAEVKLITSQLDVQVVGDEFEYARLRQLLPVTPELTDLATSPLLQCIGGSNMAPMRADLRSQHTVGYTFFEDSRLRPEAIETARREYQRVATGSSWCTKVLKEHGLENVSTVIQGVDRAIFFPHELESRLFGDQFLIFSGGKFEFRKGQDLVIRAFKVMADRHPDVTLVTAWYNQWGFSWETMKVSRHIRFAPQSNNYFQAINQILHDNGVEPVRCIHVGPHANLTFANIYRNTDVGVFPNRCEGGTNLVLMEYMACGKPVVASDNTGHADVVTRENALMVESPKTTEVRAPDGHVVADWPEPDLEQVIEQLETAYRERDRVKQLGERGAQDMKGFTWGKTAEGFLKLLQR